MGRGATAKPALAPCQYKQGCSVMLSSMSSAFWDGREKLRAQELGATATRHTASIHSILTYFGFVTAWRLVGAKGGAAPVLGTIWQLLLKALWLLTDGKSQDDPCPRHHPKKYSRMNAGSRSHGAVTTPSPICSDNGTAASHFTLVEGHWWGKDWERQGITAAWNSPGSSSLVEAV